MNAFHQHVRADHGLFTKMVYYGSVVAYTEYGAGLLDLYISGQIVYQAEFSQGADLCPFFTHCAKSLFTVYSRQQFVMNDSVGSDDLFLVGREAIAAEVGHFSACFLYGDKTCGRVPGVQFMFIKAVKTSCSYPAKVNGGRAQAAQG